MPITIKAPSPLGAPRLNKALKALKPNPTNPIQKKESIFANSAKKFQKAGVVDQVASGKPPKQSISPVASDRGSFGMKG